MDETLPSEDSPVILFDGVCNLCSGSVQFVLHRDHDRQFRFGSLQSAAGQGLLREQGLPTDDLDSVVLIEGGRAYLRSDAALRICAGLRPPWRWLGVLRIVPHPLRDAVYRWVARHRYGWFGRRASCLVPTGEFRDRFITS